MAQFYQDFSSVTVGTLPPDVTFKRATVSGDYEVATDGADNVLRYSAAAGGTAARGLSYDLVPSAGVTEIYAETRDIDAGDPHNGRLVVFASDSPDNEYGLIVSANKNEIIIYSRISGSYAAVSSTLKTINSSEYYAIRFRVTPGSPNTLQARAWPISGSEPATWDVDTTDSGLSLTSGWTGHVGFTVGFRYYFNAIGIGTNGDAAPTASPSTLEISAADNITDENGTSTFTLSGNSGNPTAARLNGTTLTGLTDLGSGVWQYNNPLLADDATATLEVDVDSTTLNTTISYANSYPYELVTHGTPDANSIFFDTQFASSQPVEWGVVTDYDPAVVTVDHAAMDAAEDELNDVDLHSTEVAAGTSTATYKYFVTESGATGTFQATITVSEPVSPPAFSPEIGAITKDDTTASIPFTYVGGDADSFEYSTDAGTTWTTTTSPISLSGLTAETSYSGLVRAVNSGGNGSASSYSFTTNAAGVVDNWPFSKGIEYAATQNWEWGKRHPKTGMRTRIYK